VLFGDEKSRLVAFLFLALRLFQNLSEVAGITAKTRVNGARLIALFAWWRDSFVAPGRRSIGTSPSGRQ